MRKLIILFTIILFVLLLAAISVSCQQQPEAEEEYIPGQIIVKFKAGTSIEAEEQLNQSLGTTVIHTSPSAGFKVLQIPEGKTVPEMVDLYSEQPIVEYAEPNYIDRLSPDSK